ncbi:hypothetical protein K8354_16740 [Polaribacter litorisediminis]|uniref:hypothetical protein n=1 Tax=Polaribacter litorisediminis TaxID=1908341 RepID=UPI001CBC0F91|nr:hypothetical protein [Polaribacter litorisediminis]UAM97913.1 hypothetical protein K8354_16740 [Polaribacter litorisediminis]
MKRFQNFNYAKTLCTFLCVCIPFFAVAQDDDDDDNFEDEPRNKATFNLGSGLNFSFNDGDYYFNMSGFIQPSYQNIKTSGLDADNNFNSKRTFLQFAGAAKEEKVSFFIQIDYSSSDPLMDAWVAYHPTEKITVSFGQKQTFVNNREMTYREDRLQFNDRSFLSQNFSNTGREFGVFVASKFGDKFGISPMFSVTSGDGRNSFGTDSRDTDLGGLKVGGRLDLFPLGYFKEGNDLTSVDLGREENLKFVVGFAGSLNKGVSNSNGEGHGDFLLYNGDGTNNLPDYNQLYADVLLKYNGFSLLAEYVNTSADNLDLVFTDANATQLLAPTQISQFLVLGDSFNVQTGYATESGFSFDARYESMSPEFENQTTSILQDGNAYTFGISKYFKNNSLKLQTSYSSINPSVGNNLSQFQVLMQIAF